MINHNILLGHIPKKGKRAREEEDEESEEFKESDEDFESPKGKARKGSKKPRRSKKKQKLTALLTPPTQEEIAMYIGRQKKEKGPRPQESAAAKAQRLALAPLAAYRSAKFDFDVKNVRRPTGVICSRNLYDGHVKELEEIICARGENFPQKTIYLALGNVSFYVC